jgi:hypothetical protein
MISGTSAGGIFTDGRTALFEDLGFVDGGFFDSGFLDTGSLRHGRFKTGWREACELTERVRWARMAQGLDRLPPSYERVYLA